MKKMNMIGFLTLAIMSFASLPCMGQHDALCGSKKEIKASNLDLKNRVYATINKVKAASLNDTVVQRLKKEYKQVQDEFNKIYDEMAVKREGFANWTNICEKFGDRLKTASSHAANFNNSANKALAKKGAGMTGGTIDQIIAVLKFAWDLRTTVIENFFAELKWKDWSDISSADEKK